MSLATIVLDQIASPRPAMNNARQCAGHNHAFSPGLRRSVGRVCVMLVVAACVACAAFAQADTKSPTEKQIKPPTKSEKSSSGSGKSAARSSEQGMNNQAAAHAIASVLQPNKSPLVSFRILFMTGSADDPQGKEGIASLTAALLASGGSRALSYDQIVEAMYPMATNFGWQVDKEMTVFSGTTHKDNLDGYYALIKQMLLDPGFRQDDFDRLKSDAISYLKVSLREGNDEELGKEQLYNSIYAGTAYGHHNMGSLAALEKLTLDDVRVFYKEHYVVPNLVIGLSGGFPATFSARVSKDFSVLPATAAAARPAFNGVTITPGVKIQIIKRETRSTAISIGFPIAVTRGDKDWVALALVASYFGQHRSSNSYLYQRLREARGLNYGDYSYIEYFPRGMFQIEPDANLGRRQQIFQIWIRPVEPKNGHFSLRAALFEYDKLVRDGLSPEAFESTRLFLSKYVNLLTATQDAALGYALDSRYYNTPEFNGYVRAQLAKLTVADVNNAIRKYLKSDGLRIVLVTRDAEELRNAILSNQPSRITYNSPKPQDIVDEDKQIAVYKLGVKPDDVSVVDIDKVFQ